MELGAEEIEFITETEGMALSEVLTTLRSLSENVGALTKDLKYIQWTMPFIVTVGILLIGVIVYLK